MTPSVQFIYFDLGNVLVSFDPHIACVNVAQLCGITAEQAERVIYRSGLEDRYERGEIDGAAFAAEFWQRLGSHRGDITDAALLDALSNMFTPVEPMREVMASVRAAGCRIGILSNTCEGHWDWIGRQAYEVLEGPFDAQVLSCRVGSMKPDRKIYEEAERLAGVPPQQIGFLDDKRENVEAARRRGWQASLCLSHQQAIDALSRMGIAVNGQP